MTEDLTELPFAKPVRVRDRKLLVSYHRENPICELSGCGRWSAPEPHHLVHRSQGGGDEHSNLLSLCRRCHREVHDQGNRRWLATHAHQLAPETLTKVLAAFRMTEVPQC